MKVWHKTGTAVIVLAILACIAGSAAAEDQPPATTTDQLPVVQTDTSGDASTSPPAGVTVTAPATPPAVTLLPVTPVQSMLLRQSKLQIAVFVQKRAHWAKLLNLRLAPVPRLSRLTSLEEATSALAKLKGQSRSLHRRWMQGRILQFRRQVEHQRLVMGQKPFVRTLAAGGTIEVQFMKWRRLAQLTYLRYSNPPQKGNFLCIHGYEGSWHDQDSGHNGHTGGVQFGYSEWDHFGKPFTGKLYAYQATPLEQLWSAYRYWQVSGFNPWPQTARDCGLL